MKRRLTTKLLFASIALAPLAAAPATTASAQSVIRPNQDIVLSIGRGELINIPGSMSDVFIADDGVADVQIKSQRQLYLFGKAGGETTVYASNATGQIIWSANVRVGSNISSIDQMLNLAMPEAKVNVATMGTNTILLTGTVGAPEDAADAQALVEAYVGTDFNVISRLRMATPLQVNLRVKVAEVSRNVVRSIGVNLATVDATSGFRFGIGQGFPNGVPIFTPDGPAGLGVGFNQATPGGSDIPTTGQGSTLGFAGHLLGLDVLSALDLAENQGLVTTLSEPNLTALSGETAEFLAGGEFPVPASGGLGSTSISFKPYGVSLSYTPTVLANGRISMRVRPEVSEISSQNAIQVGGFQIPALVTRRAETTVELGSGQSFVIAGLLSNNSQNAIEKAPGLGDIPILGNLFRSTTYRKGETELVIVVTPYLVKPVDANEVSLPTDGYLKPTELQRLIEFREADGVSGGERPAPQATAREAGPEISDARGQTRDALAVETQRNPRTAPAKPGFSFE